MGSFTDTYNDPSNLGRLEVVSNYIVGLFTFGGLILNQFPGQLRNNR